MRLDKQLDDLSPESLTPLLNIINCWACQPAVRRHHFRKSLYGSFWMAKKTTHTNFFNPHLAMREDDKISTVQSVTLYMIITE